MREFRYTDEDFLAIAGILRDEAGITLQPGKASFVYARLVKRLRALQLDKFADYVAVLQRDDGLAERRQMVTALTTNVTRFFREPHHFDHLRQHVLSPMLGDVQVGGRLRIWSAACSTGQEPYSVAAVLAGLLPNAKLLDAKILATDIDPNVLEYAQAGRYESIDGVPNELQRWFAKDGNSWQVDTELRDMVTFRHLNLNGSWPVRGPFDAIYCRNVAIYFDHEVQAKLWLAFSAVMKPGGYLYIGHSERVSGEAANLFENVGTTTYRRRDART